MVVFGMVTNVKEETGFRRKTGNTGQKRSAPI
jgi:hypothetical protein